MTAGAICGGSDWQERRVRECPTEGRRRRFYVTGAHWYGTTWTCLGCGDSWADGERGYRPFARGWRTEAIKRAAAGWSAVPNNWRALRRAAFDSYFAELAL